MIALLQAVPHAHPDDSSLWGFLAVVIAAAGAYAVLAWRQRLLGRSWSRWRTGGFLVGSALVAVALVPELVPFERGDFRHHMIVHLLIAMVAPVPLVLAAPMTLLLRSVPRRQGRRIAGILRSRPVAVISNPVVATILDLGGMAALYFTPLYQAAHHDAALHLAIHVHFLAAGCLFAWVIAGPDPSPHRPSVPVRLVYLGVAITVHAVLSQLLYAGLFVQVTAPAYQRQAGAELMYYGGDIAELMLAFALVSTWRPRRRG